MASDSLLLFFLEDPNAISADGHGDADHRLEQFHGDLFLRLVDLHDAGLLSFERPGDQLDDVALHDAADDGLRGEVRLDFRERDTGRLSLAFHDAAGPPESADDLLQAVGIHALDVDIAAEVRRDEDREHADVVRLGPRLDRVGHRAFVTDRGLHGEDRLPRAEAQRLRVECPGVALRDRVHDDVQPVPVPRALRTRDGERDLSLAVGNEPELLLRDLRESDVPPLVLDAIQLDGPLRRIRKLGVVDEVHLDPNRVILGPRVRDDDRVFFRLTGGEGDLLFLQVQLDAVVADRGRPRLGLRLRFAPREIVQETHRSQPQEPENPVEDPGTVSHDQVDHEPQGADRGDAEAGDEHDLRVLVRRGPARHLFDSAVPPFAEALRALLDPPLDLPALVHDVRHKPHRTMSTPPWVRTCSPGPRICFDLTPVKMSMTRSLCSRLGSTAAPQMIRAFGAIRPWTISATFSASATLMSFPPVTFTRAPVAALMSTSIRGELIASSIASSERLSRSDSPRPIIATPPPFMIVLMSLKSRFTRPEFVRRFAGGLLADLGECPGPEAPRDAASQEELVRRPDDQEMLGVRVRGEELRPDDAGLDEPVDRVAAAPSNADDLDVRPQAGEDPLEFGVLRADAHRLRGGFREPRLNARTTHDFPDNGIHFSASGCPRKRMKQPRHSRKGGRLINVSGFAPSSSPPVDRHGGNSADYIDADAGLLLRGISSSDNLFRLDAGRDEHDAQRVFERRVDGRAPDNPRGRRDLRLDDLGNALRLGNRHVVPARNVDQHAVGGRHIDLEERRVDRLFDCLDGAVVTDGLALAEANHRDPAAFHDRLHVVEVEVHEAGLRDDFRESFDRPHEDLVRELEREVQRLPRH